MSTFRQRKSTETPANLHNLMEATLNAHRKDIYDFATGHLNSNKLVKPPITEKKGQSLRWKSSRIKSLTRKASRESQECNEKQVDMMSSALLDFSLGTSGIFLAQNSKSSASDDGELPVNFDTSTNPLKATPSVEKLENNLMHEMEKLMVVKDHRFSYNREDHLPTKPKVTPSKVSMKLLPPLRHQSSNILVEELKLPEVMLSSLNSAVGIPPSMQLFEDESRQSNERKKFVTTHLAGITRKDQFQKMIDFDQTVLRKPETLEQNIRNGHKAVQHLEQKLVSRLLLLQMKELPPGPSFERLQLYSEIWCDLMIDSSMFGSLLSEIKEEYDNYLTHLLDSMKSSNRGELARCLNVVEGLSNEERTKTAENLHCDVEKLETLCRDALLRNHDLHEKITAEEKRIEEERRLQQEEDEENIRRMLPLRRPQHKAPAKVRDSISASRFSKNTTEKRLKILRVDIWERLDVLAEQKLQLRNCFVPKPVHRNLQHAIKDIEVEMQKLQQQNDFLMQHKQDFVEQLTSSFTSRKVDDDTIRIIWKLIEDGSIAETSIA